MPHNYSQNEFIQYLTDSYDQQDPFGRIPSLSKLSQDLGVSVARLREQLEVARVLGFVEVRPRTGMRRLPYSFLPAVSQSISYAIEIDQSYFDVFSELRNHLEAVYWDEAVHRLMPEDHADLQDLVVKAWDKLRSPQVHIPHFEHRQLHLGIYRRLHNPFVLGILEAYWEAYEAVGLNMYAGYDYLQHVWEYHQQMVEAICLGDFEAGYQALVQHKDLLYHRPVESLMGSSSSDVAQDDGG
jgi:DNA-binding FadR family transcriptional regulator